MIAGLATGFLAFAQQPATPQVRRALLIANSNYPSIAKLQAAADGVSTLKPVLQRLRFDVRELRDARLEDLDAAINKLAADTLPGDVALVVYLGLAVQSNQENFLLPADFKPSTAQAAAGYSEYSVRRIASLIDAREPAFFCLILDAAWDVPALRQRFPETGLVRMEPGPNSLFAMSASPGKTYGDGSVSHYVKALAESLATQGITLGQITDRIKRQVSEATGGAQLPSEASTVVRDFYVNPKPADETAWEKAKDTQEPAVLTRFLSEHPASRMAGEARARLDDLQWQRVTGKSADALLGFLSAYPESKHAGQAGAELDAIRFRQIAARYKAAMEGRDLAQLKAAWPSLDKKQQSKFQSIFRDAKSIAVDTAAAVEAKSEGLTGWVPVRLSIQYPGQGNLSNVIQLRVTRKSKEAEFLIDSLGEAPTVGGGAKR